ncbi:Tryptophan synthase alpha chain [BD1-7 clade bacterium]|uniref:Tryptophan synthase alpha chain n=1 Tax=BD1-7 clade bacterium TaxID=2029982 RepID=A0A5S9PRY8_9GAMM|nr:Tryptophan synthase alpha chain [BD1-7 clade bacterium]
MSRIARCLASLKEQNKKALVPYFVSGDPSPETTVDIMHALAANGADIIELGIPFSDPMAEGPVIQLAHERALEHNVSLSQTLDAVSEFRQRDNETPVVLMGYANPIEVMGYESFVKRASESGVDGVLTVDMPPEEATEFSALLKQHDLDNIYLIAPTTAKSRVELVASMASGYLYYVSLKGVTGAGNLDLVSVEENLAVIREITNLPVCVGFGIKDAESAKAISKLADGAVVGSALVDRMRDAEDAQAAIDAGAPFLRSLRDAMDSE